MRRSRYDEEYLLLIFDQALAAGVRIITWCKGYDRSFEPDVAELVDRYGERMTVIDWAKRLFRNMIEGVPPNFGGGPAGC